MGGTREGGCTHIQMWKYIWMVNQQALPTYISYILYLIYPCENLDGQPASPLGCHQCTADCSLAEQKEAAPPLQLQVHNACITPPNQKLDPKTLSETNANPKKVVSYLVQDPRVLTIAWVIQPPIIDLDHHHHCDVIICLAAISRKIHQCFGLKCHWKF